MKKVPNRKRSVKLNKIILQILLLILVSTILITQKENILNIFTNKNKIKAGIPEDMRIGDIIKYDHKTGVKPEDLKTTIGKGTASIPGSGYHLQDSNVQEQTFDASKIDTTWRVFNIDKVNKEIMIVSDSIYPEFKTYGAIDYIWYEHNMHKIASIFGHGKGAKKKEFTYKVGSQLEDTGDTATWKTGADGIPLTTPNGIPGITTKEGLKDIVVPLSGARPLRTEDIEKAFSWTESSIKTDSKFTRYGDNWGGTTALNINFPQRKVEGINQAWYNEQVANGSKKNVIAYNRGYGIDKSNVPENNYKKVLLDWNNTGSKNCYQLGQVGLDVASNSVHFSRGMVYSGGFFSASNYFVYDYADGHWREYDYTYPGRVAAFLSLSDVLYIKSKNLGRNKEKVWDMMIVGDVINYNHKEDGIRIESESNTKDKTLLETKINAGTAKEPRAKFKSYGSENAKDQNTKWRFWGLDENKDSVIIISDVMYLSVDRGNALDYIWYEYNMHKQASIFGHGKGASKRKFQYNVGSQLEGSIDNAVWETGTNNIPLSASRPLKLKDIETVFGWTESIIKSNDKFKKNKEYGKIQPKEIYFPQRDVGDPSQKWSNKELAESSKQVMNIKDGYYWINVANIPNNMHKKILFNWGVRGSSLYDPYYYQLGDRTIDIYDDKVHFSRGMVASSGLYSSKWSILYTDSEGFKDTITEDINGFPPRVLTFLSLKDVIYEKKDEVGKYQESVWDIKLKEDPNKNIEINVKNVFGKNIVGTTLNLNSKKDNSNLINEKVDVSNRKTTKILKNVKMNDEKYVLKLSELPENANYKILSKNGELSKKNHELDQDIVSYWRENLTYDIVIYPKNNEYIVPVELSQGCYNDENFKINGVLKLKDGDNEYLSQSIEITKLTKEIKFENVNYFNNSTSELKKFKLEFEFDIKSQKHIVDTSDGKIVVKYTPPKKNYDIKAEFIFDKTLDRVPIKLYADGKHLKDIDLLKSEDYIHVENLPERDNKSGKPITYTIQKGNIPSGYIIEISGLTIIIRPVLTLPMSGSDSIKLVGITAGICTMLGLGVRAKNKIAVLFKKYEMMR